MRLSPRSSDDADVIRARLRVLLAEGSRPGGWLPDDLEGDECAPPVQPEIEAQDGVVDVRLPEGIGRHRAPGPAVRVDPGRRGAWSLWAAGLVAALVLVAWTWLERPRVQPVSGTTVPATPSAGASHASSAPPAPAVGEVAETSATVVVSVVGRVRSPGLVTLPKGARVADAIAAAGGLLPGTDGSSVNLAAVVSDGEQVAVGVPGASGGATAPGGATGGGPPGPPGKVNLNTATVADLDGLPGIGPVLAQRIIDYRDQHGPFASVDQLDDVPGIGPAIFASLTKLVIV
ncbi:MAG: ComEA family DNA-binding protein [Blastococcus sp.]